MRAPRWLIALAERLLSPEDREFIAGDLEELYAIRAKEHGPARAVLASLRDVLGSALLRGSFRPGHRRDGPSHAWGSARAGMLEELGADLRHAVRSLARQPLFTAVATLTLGVGVGSAGAVFGIVNQLLLRPVPGVIDPNGVARVEIRSPEQRVMGISGPVAEELRAAADLGDGFASYDYVGLVARVNNQRPIETRAYTIYGDYFELLGVRPLVGRLLVASETGPDADSGVAVISETLWASLFDRDPDVVGRRFEANGTPITVVGVAGGDFRGTDRFWPVDVWLARSAFAPLARYPVERLWSPDSRLLQDHVVRLRRAVDREALEARLTAVLRGRAQSGADPTLTEARVSLTTGPLSSDLTEQVRPVLWILGAIVLLVLLIPCANVANLLLLRSARRRGELAVHRAMGASVGRVGRRHALESLVLASLGTTAGLLVARAIAWSYEGRSLLGLPRLEGFVLDRRAMLFACMAVAATALLFGVVPALLAGRFDLAGHLRRAEDRSTGREGKLQHGIAALQIGLSLPLLIGGVLLGRTLENIQRVDPGFEPEGVYVTTIDLGLSAPRGSELDVLLRTVRDVVAGVAGVEAAAIAPYGPYYGMRPSGRIALSDGSDAEPTAAQVRWVGPEWFEVVGMPVTAGRTFREEDWTSTGPRSVILTEPLAHRLFGDQPAVGRDVRVGLRDLEAARVVGVVGDIHTGDPRSPPDELFFLSYPIAGLTATVTPHVRITAADPHAAEQVRTALERTLPEVPVPALSPLTDRIEGWIAEQLVYMRLLSLLAALATIVAAVGLYGVVAFAVTNRTREFGIRCALGADRGAIVGLALRSATPIVAAGTAVGLLCAYGLARVIESRLFGVATLDPASYAGAVVLLVVVAMIACGIPALSAARLDPITSLRAE
jgi:putative ABC transport system permease protein